jgi:hypothetical protein
MGPAVVVVVVFIFCLLLFFFFGTRTVTSLYMPGSRVGRILARYKLDIVDVQEVRWDKGGIERIIRCRPLCLLVDYPKI